MHTDVLVVGAGPTGLMLANQLERRGVRTVLIDRHSGPAQQSRAIVVQARTLEIYQQLGVAARALELGRRGNGANLWVRGKRTARIPLGDIGASLSPFPYALILGQDDNEHILGAKLKDWRATVDWNTELIDLRQSSDRVMAEVRQPDGSTRTMSASYVAGCDGARSTVRELCGIGFPGAPYEHVFFVADTAALGSMIEEELNVYLWRDGFHLFFPMRGKDRWRVIGILPAKMGGRDDLGFDELAPAIREEVGADLEFRQCSWFSTYRIHHRCAERFRDRRCFLLGDAAHIHSPAGGQGMNTGLQDAYNLGWKLALVARGIADERLLDSFEEERVPVAQRLLRTTDRAFMLLVSPGWWGSLLRTRAIARVVAFAMTFERARKVAFRTVSQIGIRYPDSSLSHTLDGIGKSSPRAGDRFPWVRLKLAAGGAIEDLFQALDDLRFNLLVIGQRKPADARLESNELLKVFEVPDDPVNREELERAAIASPAFYLLRPDGHIGLAGTRLGSATIERYLGERGLRIEASPIDRIAPP